MAKQSESVDKCNMVFLAGAIKQLKVRDDGSAFMLVDPSGEEKSRYIPCTVYDSKELAELLGRFHVEETIQIRGYVRAWSQQKNGTWQNNMEVRITEIRNQPPVRKEPPRAKQQSMVLDDDVPF